MCQNWHSVYFTNKIEFRLFLYFDLFDLEFFRALRDKFIAVQEPKGFMQFHQLPALFFIIAHIFLMLKEVKVSSVFCNGRDLHWLSVWAVSIYREHRISTSFGRRLIETFLVLALKLQLEWATPNPEYGPRNMAVMNNPCRGFHTLPTNATQYIRHFEQLLSLLRWCFKMYKQYLFFVTTEKPTTQRI